MIHIQSNKFEFLIQKAILNEPNKVAARNAIIDELSRHISIKRLNGIILGSYEPKLADLIVFIKYFDIQDISEVLNVIVAEDFKTLEQTLEQLKEPVQQ